MSGSSVTIPPNSTGSKIATENRHEIYFDNQTIAFNVGDAVTGATSGASGTVTAVVQETTVSGQLFLKNASGVWQDGEGIEVSAVQHALVDFSGTNTQQIKETQTVIVVDPNNPEHQQSIDRFGATVNTFTNGAPVFSPFNEMQTGQRQSIKDYIHAYDEQPNDFYTQTAAGGSLSYDSDAGVVLGSCSTASGALVRRTSNFYHPYSPGVGQLILMTVRCGDAGKANVRRRWGYFDDNDGCYFELDGTTLYAVVRSSVSGSVVESRTAQVDFNNDKLDGSDSINFDLNLSVGNIYWIDLHWLGAGRVRFGVSEPNGSDIVAHTVEHANMGGSFPYMRTASLPIRWEQENTGVSASTSEFRVNCISVKHTSKVLIDGKKYSTESPFASITGTDGEVTIIAARPKTTLNSITNRSIIKLKSISFSNITTAGLAKAVIYRVRVGDSADATSPTWTSHGTSSVTEIDSVMTNVPAGDSVFSVLVAPDDTETVQYQSPTERNAFELFLGADGTTQPMFFITAEVLDGVVGDTALVGMTINWEELIN